MKTSALLLVASLGLLAGCEEKVEEEALQNFERNPNEYYNTATDPAGPRELTGPGANTGTGDTE